MRNFRAQRGIGVVLESKPVLSFLVVLLLVSVWSLVGFLGRMEETKKNKELAREKFEELEEAKTALEADITKLQSARGVEEVLREDYGLAREGEGMIIVVEDQNTKSIDNESGRGGFWGWVKGIFE